GASIERPGFLGGHLGGHTGRGNQSEGGQPLAAARTAAGARHDIHLMHSGTTSMQLSTKTAADCTLVSRIQSTPPGSQRGRSPPNSMPTPEFLTSAADPRGFLPPDELEIAFVGRSNSGKSSALNALAGV